MTVPSSTSSRSLRQPQMDWTSCAVGQTEVPVMATPPLPASGPSRSTTAFVCGSIRTARASSVPRAHTASADAATSPPDIPDDTLIVEVTVFVAGSTRDTVASEGLMTHTASGPTARKLALGPILAVATT